jgi:hypothetical protein
MKTLAGIVTGAVLAVLLSAGGAWAAKCPGLAKQANELLSGTSSNTDKYTKSKALIEEGEKLHKAGDHANSVAKLEEALKTLRTP